MYYYGRDKQRRLKRRIRIALSALAAIGAVIGLYFLIFSNKSALITQPEDLTSSEYTPSSDTIKTPRKEVMIPSQTHASYNSGKVGGTLLSSGGDKAGVYSTTPKNTVLSSSVKPDRRPSGPVYEVVSVAHFYDQPDPRTRTSDSINYWNQTYASIKPITKKNGFIYVVFKYPKGQIAKGWLREKDLKEVNTAYGDNKD